MHLFFLPLLFAASSIPGNKKGDQRCCFYPRSAVRGRVKKIVSHEQLVMQRNLASRAGNLGYTEIGYSTYVGG